MRGYEAFNAGDIEASLDVLDPEIEWHTYIVPGPGGGSYHGHDGVRELVGGRAADHSGVQERP